MIIETVCVGPLGVNCYLLAAGKNSPAVIIDPGEDEGKIRRALEKQALTAGLVINTHGHYDHIGCDECFAVPIYAHRLDIPLLKDPKKNFSALFARPFALHSGIQALEDGQLIEKCGLVLEVIHTPGHSPGGICLLLKAPLAKALFSGDTLFYHGIGRTDFPGGDTGGLISVIKAKLLTLPDDVKVYPGHGPKTSIGEEKKDNSFLR